MRFLLFGALASLVFLTFCASGEHQQVDNSGFAIRGVSFVGMPYENQAAYFDPLENCGFNWISQMPFAFERNGKADVQFRFNGQWWGESAKGITATCLMARQRHIQTLLKPQIWMGGEYTGHLRLPDDAAWDRWTEQYSRFILAYAHLADSMQMEAFCIGTELQPAISKRPEFWSALIDSIRVFYDGKLTYAANWDEYRRVPFWKKLDWIGVNAYFPLSSKSTPSVSVLSKAWKKLLPGLENFADSVQKPMVFTEIGYRSVDSSACEPWNPRSRKPNMKAQANAYQAFFESFKGHERWFHGYFLWKWYPDASRTDDRWHTDYTPQGKPAGKLLIRK